MRRWRVGGVWMDCRWPHLARRPRILCSPRTWNQGSRWRHRRRRQRLRPLAVAADGAPTCRRGHRSAWRLRAPPHAVGPATATPQSAPAAEARRRRLAGRQGRPLSHEVASTSEAYPSSGGWEASSAMGIPTLLICAPLVRARGPRAGGGSGAHILLNQADQPLAHRSVQRVDAREVGGDRGRVVVLERPRSGGRG